METASIILVEVELSVDKGFSRTQLGQKKYCYVFVVEVAGEVNRNSVVFVLLIEQLEEVVLIQGLSTVGQPFDDVGE